MQLPLQITFHGLQHSDAIEQSVRARAEKLHTFAPRIIGCRVAIEMPHRHSSHGKHYRVRIDITLPGGEVVVERLPEGNRAYEDAHAAIGAAFDDAVRRIQEFARKQRGDVKTHERDVVKR